MTYNSSVDLTDCTTNALSIETAELKLEVVNVSDGAVNFILTDKLTGETNPLKFDLRYWKGYQRKGQDNQPSGVYIFRPDEDQYDSYLYSNPSDIEITNCAA